MFQECISVDKFQYPFRSFSAGPVGPGTVCLAFRSKINAVAEFVVNDLPVFFDFYIGASVAGERIVGDEVYETAKDEDRVIRERVSHGHEKPAVQVDGIV